MAPGDDPVRVLNIDDHELTRNGMVNEMAADPRIQMVGAFGSIHTVPVPATQPANTDVVIVDLSLPHEASGMQSVERVVPWGMPVVVCTMFATSVVRDQARAAGAAAFVSKRAAAQELVSGVLAAHHGEYFEAGIEFLPDRADLSTAEVEVARMVAEGRSSREIGDALEAPSRRVDGWITSAQSKLGLDGRTRSSLAAWAVRVGLVERE